MTQTNVKTLTNYGPCVVCSCDVQGYANKYDARHCEHIFHKECSKAWKKTSNHCPKCHAVLDKRIKTKKNQIVPLPVQNQVMILPPGTVLVPVYPTNKPVKMTSFGALLRKFVCMAA